MDGQQRHGPKEHVEQHEGGPHPDQAAYRKRPQAEGKGTAQSIERQYIACPNETEMDEAEQEKPEHATKMDRGGIFAFGLCALDNQQHGGAKQE